VKTQHVLLDHRDTSEAAELGGQSGGEERPNDTEPGSFAGGTGL
jgi:hypothetical protein